MLKNTFILNITPTGMIPTKSMTPYVPISPDEIISDALQASRLGATMIHLHARETLTGLPTYKKEVYSDIIRGIRNVDKDIILCVSTSGRTYKTFEERSECLELPAELRPDFGSLTLSSVNFNKVASLNEPGMIIRLADKMMSLGIKPELEVFDLGMINFAKYLITKQLIVPPYYFNFILGNIAGAQADLLTLGILLKELPDDSIWSVGGVGKFQLKANVLSLASGGGVRIGLEDNIWYDNERKVLATNISLLKRIINIAEAIGCRPCTPLQARESLKL